MYTIERSDATVRVPASVSMIALDRSSLTRLPSRSISARAAVSTTGRPSRSPLMCTAEFNTITPVFELYEAPTEVPDIPRRHELHRCIRRGGTLFFEEGHLARLYVDHLGVGVRVLLLRGP